MRNISAGRTLAAPAADLWAVLADYPNISDWNEAMNESVALGDATEGVGAAPECQFGSKGSIKMRETVTEWIPEQRMVIAVDKLEKQLYKHASMTITLSDDGQATQFRAFMKDLERAAQGRAAA